MNLNEYLEQYRDLTLNLMDKIKKDGEIDILIKERESILKSINDLDFDKEEIKKIGNSLNLLELEEELQVLAKKEKVKIKTEIENLKRTRQANTNYNSIENKSRVFNETI